MTQTPPLCTLGSDEKCVLEFAAWMQDAGKILVPDHILTKTSRLTPEEFDVMKAHAVKGDEIVGQIEGLSRLADIVRHHHDPLNGQGERRIGKRCLTPPRDEDVNIKGGARVAVDGKRRGSDHDVPDVMSV